MDITNILLKKSLFFDNQKIKCNNNNIIYFYYDFWLFLFNCIGKTS